MKLQLMNAVCILMSGALAVTDGNQELLFGVFIINVLNIALLCAESAVKFTPYLQLQILFLPFWLICPMNLFDF